MRKAENFCKDELNQDFIRILLTCKNKYTHPQTVLFRNLAVFDAAAAHVEYRFAQTMWWKNKALGHSIMKIDVEHLY